MAKFSRRARDEIMSQFYPGGKDARDAVMYLEDGRLSKADARSAASQWASENLRFADDSLSAGMDTLAMDEAIHESFAVAYGEPLPAYADSRLSSDFRQGETAADRADRMRQTRDDEISRTLSISAGCRLDAKRIAGNDYELFDDDTLAQLRSFGYDEYEKAEMKDRGLTPESLRAPKPPVDSRKLFFNAAKPVQPVQKQSVSTPVREHRERNYDRLPKSNNYVPAGTVYNRAIPNDPWSFDEYDPPEADDHPDL